MDTSERLSELSNASTAAGEISPLTRTPTELLLAMEGGGHDDLRSALAEKPKEEDDIPELARLAAIDVASKARKLSVNVGSMLQHGVNAGLDILEQQCSPQREAPGGLPFSVPPEPSWQPVDLQGADPAQRAV